MPVAPPGSKVLEVPNGKTDLEILALWWKDDQWTPSGPPRSSFLPPGKGDDGRPECVWVGHAYGNFGYARMNRELILRVANTFRVSYQFHTKEPIHGESEYARLKLDALRYLEVSPSAIMIRGYTPLQEYHPGYRICYTMMETHRVHPTFVGILNANYNECWVPTEWNAESLESSGLKIPVNVMPLGVNPLIFRPKSKTAFPSCELLSTDDAGKTEVPSGFCFLTVAQPTFRKGFDVLVDAFEKSFADDPDVCLIIATTNMSARRPPAPFLSLDQVVSKEHRARIYALTGNMSDFEMASLYNAADVYVCTSRGEGWNLPLTEAAACGVPVIAPRHTAHLDYLHDSNATLFDPEGWEPIDRSGEFCPWYEGQSFAKYGPDSIREIASLFVPPNPFQSGERSVRRK